VTKGGAFDAGDTISLTIDGTAFEVQAAGDVADLDALVTLFTNGTYVGANLSTIGSVANDSGSLVFTYTDATAVHAGGTDDLTFDQTNGTLDGTPTLSHGTIVATQADQRTTDKFKIAVGSVEVETAAAQYNTVAEVATALNTAAQANADAKFGVSEVGGKIVIEYNINGNQTPVTADYTLVKSNGIDGTGGADAAANPAIVEGVNDASSAIEDIDAALAEIAKDRAALGATQHS
jgi:flagellin-like hook-associated protein FlgL